MSLLRKQESRCLYCLICPSQTPPAMPFYAEDRPIMSLLRNLSLPPSREQESRCLDSRFRGKDILRHYTFRGRAAKAHERACLERQCLVFRVLFKY